MNKNSLKIKELNANTFEIPNNQDFSIINFDSALFGFKVAKILPTQLNETQLQKILHLLRQIKVKLVYWSNDQKDSLSQQAAYQAKGFLADMKATYITSTELKNMHLDKFPLAPEIIEYRSNRPCVSIQKIAIQAGNYSRFKVDPQFPEHLFLKLYKTWIKNSTNGKIAKHVLAFKNGNRYLGLITLGEKNGRGDIGLLAVDPAFRGQKIGEKLVIAAQKYLLQNGYKFSQVVTQLGNKPACNLYEKCGYKLEKIENVYHFWL